MIQNKSGQTQKILHLHSVKNEILQKKKEIAFSKLLSSK